MIHMKQIKKNITVTSIGSLFDSKKFFEPEFFIVLSDSDLIPLLIIIKPKNYLVNV